MHRKTAWLILLASTALPLHASSLVSGPMLGYVEHREAAVIVEVVDASEVSIEFSINGDDTSGRKIVRRDPWVSPAGTQPVRFVLNNLEPGKAYTYRIFIDGVSISFSMVKGSATRTKRRIFSRAPSNAAVDRSLS